MNIIFVVMERGGSEEDLMLPLLVFCKQYGVALTSLR